MSFISIANPNTGDIGSNYQMMGWQGSPVPSVCLDPQNPILYSYPTICRILAGLNNATVASIYPYVSMNGL